MKHEENLSLEDILLFIRKRNVNDKTYGEFKEIVYHGESNRGPTIDELKFCMLNNLDMGNNEVTDIQIAKFVNHEYLWHHITLEEIENENNKKKANKKKGKKGKKGTSKIYK